MVKFFFRNVAFLDHDGSHDRLVDVIGRLASACFASGVSVRCFSSESDNTTLRSIVRSRMNQWRSATSTPTATRRR